MKTNEQINQLKQISIIDYLSGRGITPVSKNGYNFLYHSPLRQDSTPSFSVSTKHNVFNDFGNDTDKGSIIDLVMKLEKIGFVDACSLLEEMDDKRERDGSQALSLSCSLFSQETTKNYTINSVSNLQDGDLIRYLKRRGISLNTAFNYLKEIHYTNSRGCFFGAGYETDNGGYIVRNGIMKKTISLVKSGIKTFTVPSSNTISVFEGMFDFLSAIEYYKRPPKCTAIVLNSVTNLSKAMPQLTVATTIYSYMDNDEAGREATQKMRDGGLNVQNCSNIYSEKGFKDFNDFLTSTI